MKDEGERWGEKTIMLKEKDEFKDVWKVKSASFDDLLDGDKMEDGVIEYDILFS